MVTMSVSRAEVISSLQGEERERQWHYTQLELISQKIRNIPLTSAQSVSTPETGNHISILFGFRFRSKQIHLPQKRPLNIQYPTVSCDESINLRSQICFRTPIHTNTAHYMHPFVRGVLIFPYFQFHGLLNFP